MKHTRIIKDSLLLRFMINKGKFYKGRYLVIYTINSKNDFNQFAVCVSKKNGIAAHRNNLKRWVREIYKNEEEKLNKSLNIVVMLKKTTVFEDVNYEILTAEIKDGLNKLNVYQ